MRFRSTKAPTSIAVVMRASTASSTRSCSGSGWGISREVGPLLLENRPEPLEHAPSERREVGLAGNPRSCDCGHGDAAGVDVIGVVVAAELVVGHDDVGSVALEQARQAFGGIVDGDVAEHVGPVLVLPVDHARVVVPEQLEMRDAERLARSLELVEADAGDLGLVVALVSGLDPTRCVAELAVRARDDHGAHAVVRVPGQDAPRAR